MDEAAEIDGCGKMGIFFRIVLPLVTPAIITSTIFSFYWIWQDFFQPLIFISSTRMFTVSLALNLYLDPNSFSNYGGLFAMSVISLIPVVAVFLVFQRYLVEGVATTGLKG
ncbi:ABC transporter permease subunit [Paenibacillus macerans]|nr:ABC transporter permease subunit [Paenibacillus macerans]